MGTSCTQLHMFYVANMKSRESETSTYYNLHEFVCHYLLKTTQYLAHTIIIILQYAIYRYSLLAILYCIAVVKIAIMLYRYFDILFHP